MEVKETQTLASGKEAVKSLDVAMGEEYGEGFYNSCKDVKFGATNGLAMDLLGGKHSTSDHSRIFSRRAL